jgi:hypothetical protein
MKIGMMESIKKNMIIEEGYGRVGKGKEINEENEKQKGNRLTFLPVIRPIGINASKVCITQCGHERYFIKYDVLPKTTDSNLDLTPFLIFFRWHLHSSRNDLSIPILIMKRGRR